MKSSATLLFAVACLGLSTFCCATGKGDQSEPNPSTAGQRGSTATRDLGSGGTSVANHTLLSSGGSPLLSAGGSPLPGTHSSPSNGSGGVAAVGVTSVASNTIASTGGTAPLSVPNTLPSSGGAVTTTIARTTAPSASGGTASTSTQSPTTVPSGTKYAIIIKAAGYLTTPGVDTLTGATSKPYNTHVFADALAQHLRELNVTTSVVAWVNCTDLSCIHVPGSNATAAIVVFAGPMYNGNLPDELQALVPRLGSASPRPKVTSALASCNECTSFTDFIPLLKEAGLTTVPSVYFNGEKKGGVTDASMHASLSSFAQALVQGS